MSQDPYGNGEWLPQGPSWAVNTSEHPEPVRRCEPVQREENPHA